MLRVRDVCSIAPSRIRPMVIHWIVYLHAIIKFLTLATTIWLNKVCNFLAITQKNSNSSMELELNIRILRPSMRKNLQFMQDSKHM